MRLRVMDWNTKVGRDAQQVAETVDELVRRHDQPHVVILHEAHAYRSAVRDRLQDRYRVFSGLGWAKAASTIVLVSHRVHVRKWWPVRMRVTWTGPQGGFQPGRTMPVIRLDRWTVVGVHKAWGLPRGRNLPAIRDEYDRLVQLASRKSMHRKPLVMVGDWNATATNAHPLSPGGLADRIGGRIVSPGKGVDLAVVRGCHGGGWAGERHGSDHPVHMYRFVTKDHRSFVPDHQEDRA